MKGDFSRKAAVSAPNDLGVLYQQGRVISDRDLTEAELIAEHWRETAARDVIGAGVAAVPAADPDGYRVEAAFADGAQIDVRLAPGRIWADGIPLTLPPEAGGSAPVFSASYLAPPVNPDGTSIGSIVNGTRDAVVLEVAVGALNGFQDPDRLIEPALGGPDTALRIHPHQCLRLVRLGRNEDCHSIRPRLADDLSEHGRLSVTLEPATVIPGDCPVADGGGYSGFEHNLYRIEIAETSGAAPMFKWSSLNGGLVGRGRFFGGVDPRVQITANRAAILNSGITEYYLEALEYAEHLGQWRVVYGTRATLNADGDIDLAAPATFGILPGAGNTVFFRLWNGIEPVAGFTGGTTPFRDGIELEFHSAPARYNAGDFWTFDLRADEIANPEILHDTAPPEGPIRHRVPLAEITWTGELNTDIGGEIKDCRRRFRPLTNQKVCCTYLVGNGVTSFGDFNSLEEAVAHLPSEGGQICLMPGIHMANLLLFKRRNIKIHGCHERTMVLPRMKSFADPVIEIDGGSEIEIADIDFFAPFGIAVDARGGAKFPLRGLSIRGCRVLSLTYGFRIEWAQAATIRDNRVWLLDHMLAHSAISIRAMNSTIERNVLGVWPFEFKPPVPGDEEGNDPPDPADPCIEPEDLYGNITQVVGYVLNAWLTNITAPPEQPYRARGGLHLRGSSQGLDVIENRIDGGASHGIILGGAYASEIPDDTNEEPGTTPQVATVTLDGTITPGRVVDEAGAPVIGLVLSLSSTSGAIAGTAMSGPPDGRFTFDAPTGTYRVTASLSYVVSSVEVMSKIVTVTVRRQEVNESPDAGFLRQIRIIDNTVQRMGLSGIGFLLNSLKPSPPLLPNALTPAALTEFLVELIAPRELIGTTNLVRDLEIRGNRLQDNLRAVFTDELRAIATKVAMGGISLPLVEGLRITDNHIVRNGTSAANPSAGIFVGYGEEMIISGNFISGNGPVGDDYDTAGIEGLRGGIVVRLAAASMSVGQSDAKEKPALDIRDNHIDQPAGRAITAAAFGPVSCVGNHLNSEREGRWSLLDRLIGAVLILNLGGLHRHFTALGHSSFFGSDPANGGANAVGLAPQQEVAELLPGGEVMFNSNRVRTGGDNLAFSSMFIGTLDDLGFDANQSAMFKANNIFTNLTALGMTVRVTDNRLRERARRVAMSGLVLSLGLSGAGRTFAMNMAVHNQADHCIIATGNGFQPLLDRPNQVVFDEICPVEEKEKGVYLLRALFELFQAVQQPKLDLEKAEAVAPVGLSQTIDSVAQFQGGLLETEAAETVRLAKRGEQSDKRLAAGMQEEMYRRQGLSDLLREQSRLVTIREAAEPEDGGLVIDGRVTDAGGRAMAGAEVVLVDGRGRKYDVSGVTDAKGYYALEITPDLKKRLARVEGLTIHAVAPAEDAISIPAATLLKSEETRVRADIKTMARKDFQYDLPKRAAVIGAGSVPRNLDVQSSERPVNPAPAKRSTYTDDPFKEDNSVRPEPPASPTAPVEPARPDKPTEEPEEDNVVRRPGRQGRRQRPLAERTVSLSSVRGIGPGTERRLRAAGIETANQLAAQPDAQLREVLGNRAKTIRAAAKEAMRRARRDKPET